LTIKFKLVATQTTKWLRIKDLIQGGQESQPKLSVVTDGVGQEVPFEAEPSDSSPPKGLVNVDMAPDVRGRPGGWTPHTTEMQPQPGQTYPIDDTP
jgi:hypothetical protein